LAALLVAARPATRGELGSGGARRGAGVALLAGPENGVFDALTRTWIVLVTVAFAAGARGSRATASGRWPASLPLRRRGRHGLGRLEPGGARALDGSTVEATRDASRAMRYVVESRRSLSRVRAAVRLLAAWPLWLVIESLAGLALAWRSHAVIARYAALGGRINH